MLNKKNIGIVMNTLAILDPGGQNHGHQAFYQGTFGSLTARDFQQARTDPVECETLACIAGWTVMLLADNNAIHDITLARNRQESSHLIHAHAARLLGIDPKSKTAFQLFAVRNFGGETMDDPNLTDDALADALAHDIHEIHPSDAAIALQYLMEHNRIDWHHILHHSGCRCPVCENCDCATCVPSREPEHAAA